MEVVVIYLQHAKRRILNAEMVSVFHPHNAATVLEIVRTDLTKLDALVCTILLYYSSSGFGYE